MNVARANPQAAGDPSLSWDYVSSGSTFSYIAATGRSTPIERNWQPTLGFVIGSRPRSRIGSDRIGTEIKAGRAERTEIVERAKIASSELDASHVWLIDQGKQQSPLAPHIDRCGMAESLDWLP